MAAVGRQVSTLCKGEVGLLLQTLYQTYYNFCLPQASLRQALPRPEPTKGTGSAKQRCIRLQTSPHCGLVAIGAGGARTGMPPAGGRHGTA